MSKQTNMATTKAKTQQVCKSCSLRGYSPEICTFHHKYMDGKAQKCQHHITGNDDAQKSKLGKILAVGACAGVLTSALGITAACVIGIKGALEAIVAAKVVAGAGMAGAMTNIALKSGDGHEQPTTPKKRKHFVPPLYL